jgi:RNA polymerase sigma-70 factor (ECF subfamily)
LLQTELDAQLVARARRGEVEAFNQLISRWEKRLYHYLLGILRNREDSLDVCQETFLKAYRSLGSLQDAEKFPHWLFRIAHNLAFSQFREVARQERAVSWPDEDQEDVFTTMRNSAALGSAGMFSGPEMELTVAKALKSLTQEQREAIVLKVYQGFQFAEIAEILSCPVSTVKSRIYSGFAQLKELLTSERPTRTLPPRRW